MTQYQLYSLRQRPDLVGPSDKVIGSVWPEFMLNDPVADRYWGRLTQEFAGFQFVLCDEADEIIAVGNSLPVVWDSRPESLPERGWDAIFEQGYGDYEAGRTTNTLSALSISIAASHQGRGLSPLAVKGMRYIAARHGLQALIAPVRPSFKSHYPLTPMERYAHWKREDGAPFDPWLRVHWKLGARQLRIAPESMTISGSIAEWEEWTGMRFPESGQYVIPGALETVWMDLEQDKGTYVEPNVWMAHQIEDEDLQGFLAMREV